MAEVKHDFDGIAGAGASLVFNALRGSGASFLTWGIFGSITFFVLKKLFNFLANQGLVILNLGADLVSTQVEKHKFDKALEEAIEKVKNKQNLTKEEMDAIDEPVRAAFRKFVSFV